MYKCDVMGLDRMDHLFGFKTVCPDTLLEFLDGT